MQTIFEYTIDREFGVAGQQYDANFAPNWIYRALSGGQTKQSVAAIAVAGTIATETFTVTVPVTLLNGTTASAVATVVADSVVNTAAEVEAALAAALNNNNTFAQVAQATAISGNLVITARDYGTNPIGVVACTASGSATITAAPAVTAAAAAAPVPYGFGVGIDATDSDTECRLFTTGLGILGIAAASFSDVAPYPPSNAAITSVTPDSYLPRDIVKIWDFACKGQRVIVPIADTPTRNAVPYLNNTTGAVQAASSGGTALTGAKFFTSKVGGLVVIQF